MTHAFDTAVRLDLGGDGVFTGATCPAYANMVGPFGGTTGAAMLQAALLHPQRQGDPVALTVNFAGPVADGAFRIEARPVRTNRSTQHWSLQMTQGESVVTTASAVFATRRETWSAHEAPVPAGLPPAASLPRASVHGRPGWVQAYDMRFIDGPMPATFRCATPSSRASTSAAGGRCRSARCR